jgi:S1-C subfamily serine protease
MDFIVANGLAYRGGSPWLHRFLSPSGPFIPDTETQGIDDLTLSSGGVTINVLTSGFPFAADLHISIANRLLQHQQPYIVRNATRMVTAQGLGSPRIYVRSDVSSDGLTWFTTLIGENTGADPRLFDVIAASISLDPTAEIYAPNGRLASLVAADTAFASLPPEPIAPISPEPVTAPPEQPSGDEGGEISGAGTAFFVNNTDLVTAKHVVEDCARVTFDDGTQLTVVSEDQTLDLALLTSPQRSRDWIPVHLTGKAQLGQRIVALGYPFYGELGTALNSTGGDVSALTGLGDDPDVITISAPIHPGNSGGPLLGVDGTVIGVVVATIDKLAVATATGNIPENINFAVTGEKLLAFLESEGVSLPRQEADAVDFDTGIPESMQRAVVPIICEGS